MIINEIVTVYKDTGKNDVQGFIKEFFENEEIEKNNYDVKDVCDTLDYLREREELLKLTDSKGKGWKYISTHVNLPFEFIREFKDNLYWDRLVYNIPYDEEFMDEFKDRLNWRVLFLKYSFSKDFLWKHQDLIRTSMMSYDIETMEV